MLRVALFALMALGLAGFGFIAWVTIHPPAAPVAAPAPVIKSNVLAVANTLTAGSLMKPDDLETKEVPQSEVPPGARLDTPVARAELFGAMVRQTMLAHQIILANNVMRPGDHGFLAAVLGAGKRAISVGVDVVSGTAGLIWPGDHVDLILTMDNADPTQPVGKRISGETVLSDVRVIAIDQQLVQGAGGAAPTANSSSRTVTLEVSPDDAERVAVASRLGKLALSVRPVDAKAEPDKHNTTVTYSKDVSKALGQHDVGTSVHVFDGNQGDKEYKF